MRSKLMFVAGAALGYVVGTRRGRRGYEQIKAQATDLWNNPKIKQTVSDVQQFAKDKLPAVAPILATAAHKVSGSGGAGDANADNTKANEATGTSESPGSTIHDSTPIEHHE